MRYDDQKLPEAGGGERRKTYRIRRRSFPSAPEHGRACRQVGLATSANPGLMRNYRIEKRELRWSRREDQSRAPSSIMASSQGGCCGWLGCGALGENSAGIIVRRREHPRRRLSSVDSAERVAINATPSMRLGLARVLGEVLQSEREEGDLEQQPPAPR